MEQIMGKTITQEMTPFETLMDLRFEEQDIVNETLRAMDDLIEIYETEIGSNSCPLCNVFENFNSGCRACPWVIFTGARCFDETNLIGLLGVFIEDVREDPELYSYFADERAKQLKKWKVDLIKMVEEYHG